MNRVGWQRASTGRPGTRRALLGTASGAAGMAGAALLGACRGGDAPVATRRAVTLQYWSRWPSGPQHEVEERNLPRFMEQFAPIKVERTGIPGSYDDLPEKVTTAFASGTAPDVFTMGSSGIVAYAHPGSAMQLDAHARLRREAADFFGPPLEVGKYQDKVFGLTYFVDSRMPIYRRDMLAEVGAPTERKALPKTWEQFRDVTRRLAKWEGAQLTRVGFDVPKTGDAKLFMTMVAQQGKNIYDPRGTKVAFDGQEGQRALQTIVDLVHRDRVDSFQRPQMPSGVETLATPYVAGKFGNSALIASVANANLDPKAYLVADFTPEFTPKVTAASYLGGTWQMASKTTRDVEATVELIAFLVGPQHLLALAEATTTVPARKSLDKAPYLQDPLLRPFYESLQYGWSVPQHPRHREIETKLIEMVSDATQQKKGVQQALGDAAAFANALLASG
ncbi:MAG TPA: extracellular solute-binding protein [Chloroflexota bacterium]|nr:extracellular solute-binding protein [Chloroflexota bacterium]